MAEKTLPKQDRLLTVKEAEELTGLAQVTLWRKRKAKELVALKSGNQIRFRESDLLALFTPEN